MEINLKGEGVCRDQSSNVIRRLIVISSSKYLGSTRYLYD